VPTAHFSGGLKPISPVPETVIRQVLAITVSMDGTGISIPTSTGKEISARRPCSQVWSLYHLPTIQRCLQGGGRFVSLRGVFQDRDSWYENIFGEYGLEEVVYVKSKLELGRGLTTTPNLFTGSGQEGVKVFVQTSTGEIKELLQENLPLGEPKSGRASWKEFMR